MSTPSEVTQLLLDWAAGDAGALDRLIPLIHSDLHSLAARRLSREPRRALQPTELVNEVYLKLIDQKRVSWQNRAQFFAIAARVMRRILIDVARRHQARKRKADLVTVTFSDLQAEGSDIEVNALAIEEALEALERLEPRQARIVEAMFFGGLTIEETAEALGISRTTVNDDWRLARAFLHHALGAG